MLRPRIWSGDRYPLPLPEGTVAIHARTVALAVAILGGGRAEIGQTAGG